MSDVKRLTNEYEREPEYVKYHKRIDKARTKNNYEMRPRYFHYDLPNKLKKRLSEVKHSNRKDLNVLSTWVITCPQPLLESEEKVKRFFEVAFALCENRYGKENVLQGYVHRDETTPHIHVPIVPVKDGRVSAKALFNKTELSVFQKELEKLATNEFGMQGLVLNGRTKGNYTVAELKARSAEQDEMKRKREKLENDERALNTRVNGIIQRQRELEEYEKELKRRERVLRAEELNDKVIGDMYKSNNPNRRLPQIPDLGY